MPKTLKEFSRKIFLYAKGDARSKVWVFPGKGLTSHNIKATLLIIRYIIGLAILLSSIVFPSLLLPLLIMLSLYILWSLNKVYSKTREFRAGLWGIATQFTSDIAVISGYIHGLLHI
jgi:hypothetical protein